MQPIKLFIPKGLTCKSPFTYIIEHIPSYRLYFGCKYGKRVIKECDSLILMTEEGYQTSSKAIKELIKEYGIDSFRILYIRHYMTEQEVRIAESKFLHTVNAKNNPRYINNSNGNEGFYRNGPHSEESKKKMSNAKLGKILLPSHCKNISLAVIKRYQEMTPEIKEELFQSMSIAQLKRREIETIEQKEMASTNISIAKIGSTLSDAHCQNISIAHQNKSPEQKERERQFKKSNATGNKLYDKIGEKSRRFKEQPEDPLWIPRIPI